MHILKKLIFILFVFNATITNAQIGGPAIFSVDGDTVWGAEFERVFSKNDKTPDVRPTMAELEEYLDLYVRFKLKVKEAYTLGMDTNQNFIKELAGYRKQLAQPYLTDKTVTENLIQEAFDRMKSEIEASNLMIHLSPAASPADTLLAWNRINNWRNIISSGKKTFEQITRDSSTDDHGRKNEGRLGYFTAFSMIYPFENQAYNTKVGAMSVPFRTLYGYHILKVTDKRTSRGDLKVAHILIRVNNETEYEKNKPRIDAIYDRLENGEDFKSLVMDFSEDFNTRESGGQLNWLKSIGGAVPEDFKESAYTLKDGAYSKPVKTELGWHIIKRIEQKGSPKFKEVKESIKFKIGRDSRSELNKEAVLKRIKVENKFTINQTGWNAYLTSLNDTSLLYNWVPTAFHTSNTALFTIGDKTYTYSDFTKQLRGDAARKPNQDVTGFCKDAFESFADNMNFQYEESVLESKYDDFKYLMQEYRDGILLFELSNKTVWNKASEDTAGLRTFFEGRRDNYVWKPRAVTKSYVCSSKKSARKVKKYLKKDSSDKAILTAVNKDDALGVNIVYKTYETGQTDNIDHLDWNKSLHKIKDKSTNNKVFIRITDILPSGRKKLKETLGPVTSDYQKFLEEKWIEDLKVKYPVALYDGALNELFSDQK
ncbi:MAG: peptidylprolyl isomerase [Bacteroidetes bacterium]|jgi:peptidyl-prolyl cis-trans isomerase SurA|nr:peptidylprolyl isomerase [Bacteroidota bacterium]